VDLVAVVVIILEILLLAHLEQLDKEMLADKVVDLLEIILVVEVEALVRLVKLLQIHQLLVVVELV
jgi:hypothetical protein